MTRKLATSVLTVLVGTGAMAASGDLLWLVREAETYGCSQVAALEGLVFTYGYGRQEESLPTSPLLRAYDVTSGSEVWARRGDEAFGRVTSGRGLAVAASRVVTIEQINLGSFNPPGPAAVNAFDAATGELLWRRALPDDGVVRGLEAVAVGRSVVVAVGGRVPEPDEPIVEFMVLAYDAATGEPLWSDNFDLAGGYNLAREVVVKNGRVPKEATTAVMSLMFTTASSLTRPAPS